MIVKYCDIKKGRSNRKGQIIFSAYFKQFRFKIRLKRLFQIVTYRAKTFLLTWVNLIKDGGTLNADGYLMRFSTISISLSV